MWLEPSEMVALLPCAVANPIEEIAIVHRILEQPVISNQNLTAMGC